MQISRVEVNRGSGIFPTRQPDQPLKVEMTCADPVGEGARTVTVRNVGRIGTGPIRIVPMSASQDPTAVITMPSIARGRARTIEVPPAGAPEQAAVEFAVAARVGSTLARCPSPEKSAP